MQEFVKKLIERLEEREKCCHNSALIEIINNGHSIYAECLLSQSDTYVNIIGIVNQLAEEYADCYKDCGQCESYDKEKHHCPKFCEVITNALAEMEENRGGWILCSEKLPEEGEMVLTCDRNGWISVNANIPYNGSKNDFECGYYTAWQPLPPKYESKGEWHGKINHKIS